ncbi:glycerone kinase [Arthrobacter sp. Hiyo8]|nr:glycerone kinase [Arthrobacter sp. Hiyo8]
MQTKIAANTHAMKRWLGKAETTLGNHSDRLNAINIFPVADGDTGTNLYLTVRSAAASFADRSIADEPVNDVGAVLAAAGRVAMEQARGTPEHSLLSFCAQWPSRWSGTPASVRPCLPQP